MRVLLKSGPMMSLGTSGLLLLLGIAVFPFLALAVRFITKVRIVPLTRTIDRSAPHPHVHPDFGVHHDTPWPRVPLCRWQDQAV